MSGGGRALPPPLTPLNIAAATAAGEAELDMSVRRRAAHRSGRAGPSGGGGPRGHMSPAARLSPAGGHMSSARGSPGFCRTGALHASGRGPRGGVSETTDMGVTIRKMEAYVRSARKDLGLGPGAHDNVDHEGVDAMRATGRRLSGLGPGTGGDGVVRLPQI
jgi:hypothetical protein